MLKEISINNGIIKLIDSEFEESIKESSFIRAVHIIYSNRELNIPQNLACLYFLLKKRSGFLGYEVKDFLNDILYRYASKILIKSVKAYIAKYLPLF